MPGVVAELVEQLVAQREVGGGEGDEGSYQVSFGDSAAEQSADVQGELVEANGGVGIEQDGELAGWGRFGGCRRRGAIRGCCRGGILLVLHVCGPTGHGLSFLSVVSTRS